MNNNMKYNIPIVCDNKNCKAGGIPYVKVEVSANYCNFQCAIEAEGWIAGFFLRFARDR